MRRLSQRNTGKHLLRYGSAYGDERLREELAAYLRRSRGLAVEADGLLITRGSQQAFHLAARLLLRQGGLFAVAVLHYGDFSAVARECGGEILLLPQDERGLNVEYLRDHPRITELRAVYITPHHQYPTTVTLSAERRLLLLQLAATYQFAVLEDDYDYDFQYAGPAQLPLAALDRDRTVLYLGSFSKVIAPNVRVGYLCGPPDLYPIGSVTAPVDRPAGRFVAGACAGPLPGRRGIAASPPARAPGVPRSARSPRGWTGSTSPQRRNGTLGTRDRRTRLRHPGGRGTGTADLARRGAGLVYLRRAPATGLRGTGR